MLALYISEALNQTNALVFSAANPVPIAFPQLTFSDVLSAAIYIVDGSGGYSAASGAVGSTVTVSIGLLDDAEWSNSNWTISADPAGWTGLLSPDGDDLFDLFHGRSSMIVTIQVKVVDTQGNSRTYLTMPVTIIQSMAPAGTIESIKDGEYAIDNGAETVTVTGLGLQAIPRRVLVNIQKPSGGYNIFGTVVKDTITADGFRVDLSGVTDSANYKLEYQLTFG
jgi:hypothetical protein